MLPWRARAKPLGVGRRRAATHLCVVLRGVSKVVFPPGKTVNSYRRNHDIMGMLPIPPKAVERGLAPPDLFPHKSSAKTPVLSYGVSHQKQTPYPPNLQNRDHEFNAPLFLWPCSRRWTTRGNGHTDRWGVRMQRIGAVVVAAGALHRRYDHHFLLGAGSTIRRFVLPK